MKKLSKVFHFLGITPQDILIAVGAILVFLIFVPVFTYVYFAHDIDSKDKIMNLKDTGVVLLDDQNKPFFTLDSAQYRNFVALDQIPKISQEAVIASEDKGFYSHTGFSVDGIARSLMNDLGKGGLVQGGSTITQQLVKNALLNPNKSFLRKYQEITLAEEIERRYSKNEILEMYLNSVYFGQGAFGIDQAAQVYFGKKAQDLDLAQSALLAGLLPAPTQLSPISGNKQLAMVHQRTVLEKMYEQHYITHDQLTEAEGEQLSFANKTDTINALAPHFAMMVRDELIQKYGEEEIARSGYQVHTTLNSELQAYAERAVKNQVATLKPNNVSNGAVIAMDPKSGAVKALVGSVDWYNGSFGKVNIALASRQPGSSFKPIVYSNALERHLITPATILPDVPTTFDNCPGADPIAKKDPRCQYKPNDFDNKFWGPITARRALANSRNVPAIEVIQKIGVPAAIDMAQRLGITTLSDPSHYGLALGLGAGEVRLIDMATAYSAFANAGEQYKPMLITSIDDKFGNEVYHADPQAQNVLEPEVAFLISSILSDNKARAEEFGNTLTISRTAAVKTGTTENFVDAWTMGYTPDVVVGAWVGNNDNTPMDQIAGSLGAAPIWKAVMEKALEGTPVHAFVMPEGVVAGTACGSVGGNPKQASASATFSEYFIKGTEPQRNCYVAQNPSPSSTSVPFPGSMPPATPPPSPSQPPSPQTSQTPTPSLSPEDNNKVQNNNNSTVVVVQ